MPIVKYDAEELGKIIESYNTAVRRVSKIKEAMEKDVQIIRDSWQGEDAQNAEKDLKSIEIQIGSISSNLAEIVKMLLDVQEHFGQLKY